MVRTTTSKIAASVVLAAFFQMSSMFCDGLSTKQHASSRRDALGSILGGGVAAMATLSLPNNIQAASAAETTDVDNFLRSGGVAMPMGVSGQAGKAKPITGVLIREGTEIARDSKSGDVLAEILVQKAGGSDSSDLMAVVTTFKSPWQLATGAVYDVECRDTKTGDGAFLAVTPPITGGSLADIKDQFVIKSLFGPRGRFSFYGQPTDVKVKKSTLGENNGIPYKILDVSFSTLSQATQTEVPRRSTIVVTVPKGSKQAVMLVGSASAFRWSKGADKAIGGTVDSFRATPAPPTNLKLKAVTTERGFSEFDTYENINK